MELTEKQIEAAGKEFFEELLAEWDDQDAAMSVVEYTADNYPRNAANQFVPKADLAEAAREPGKAAALRDSLPEDQRAKFDAVVARLCAGGTVHHPKENPGLAVDASGDVADPAWAAYARAASLRAAWEGRESARTGRVSAARAVARAARAGGFRTKLVKAVLSADGREDVKKVLAEYTEHLDAVDALVSGTDVPGELVRRLARARSRADARVASMVEVYVSQLNRTDEDKAEEEKWLFQRQDEMVNIVCAAYDEVSDLHEGIAEAAHARAEAEAVLDKEPEVPEEPVDARATSAVLSVDDVWG